MTSPYTDILLGYSKEDDSPPPPTSEQDPRQVGKSKDVRIVLSDDPTAFTDDDLHSLTTSLSKYSITPSLESASPLPNLIQRDLKEQRAKGIPDKVVNGVFYEAIVEQPQRTIRIITPKDLIPEDKSDILYLPGDNNEELASFLKEGGFTVAPSFEALITLLTQ